MSKPERRRYSRRRQSFPVSLRTTQSIELSGDSVNVSDHGMLLHARGRIPLFLEIRGKLYRGYLVRAFPLDDGSAYAIELEDATLPTHDSVEA